MKLLSRLSKVVQQLRNFQAQMDSIQQALGRVEARQTALVAAGNLEEAEFTVSSQWGEDGILYHILRHVPVQNRIFVEFGVEDYTEANTRFLLRHRNWAGLVIDGSEENVARIRSDPIYWRHNLKAVAGFITRDNINDFIAANGIDGDIGLLSIDIDGNDYWVWEAIHGLSPRIVIAEYNALFGPEAAVSIPYDPEFQRTRAHHSNLYWGCSLAALEHLGKLRGFALVGCNSSGNNAFFVRKDLASALPLRSAAKAYRQAQFREGRNSKGELTFLTGGAALKEIAHLPLVEVTSGKTITVDCIRLDGFGAAGA